jgi:hypothetical protein
MRPGQRDVWDLPSLHRLMSTHSRQTLVFQLEADTAVDRSQLVESVWSKRVESVSSSRAHVLVVWCAGTSVRTTVGRLTASSAAIHVTSSGTLKLRTWLMLSPKESISLRLTSPHLLCVALAVKPPLPRFKCVSDAVILESFLRLVGTNALVSDLLLLLDHRPPAFGTPVYWPGRSLMDIVPVPLGA